MRGLISRNILMLALGVGLAACGEGADGADGGDASPGGGKPDGGSSTADTGGGSTTDTGGGSTGAKYTWIAIADEDKTPVCTATSGPGADIDAVDLRRGTSTSSIGVGLTGSASLAAATGATPCTGCGSSMGACRHSGAEAASRVEGIQDAMSYAEADKVDTGYVSINSNVLWLQIGSATGQAPAQDLLPGDRIQVYEVDKYYVALGKAPNTCACAPEKYTVWAYVTKGDTATRVQLKPTRFWSENATECGATPPAAGGPGCGTTEFTIP